jgi:hypothetical protein
MRFLKFMTLITLQASLFVFVLGIAEAEPSKTKHSMVKSKTGDEIDVNTLQPKEADDKNAHKRSGWNGSYVGMNAGTSFGATAGTNLIIPLGSDEK